VAFMAGGQVTGVATVALWPLVPATSARVVAWPALAVAVKDTGEPVSPAAVAVAPWLPVAVPSTRVAVAMPDALLIEVGVMLPPPVTPQVTVVPATGLLPR